jgi:hypothetical protein
MFLGCKTMIKIFRQNVAIGIYDLLMFLLIKTPKPHMKKCI